MKNIETGKTYKVLDRNGKARHWTVNRVDTADYIPFRDKKVYFEDNTGRQSSVILLTFIRCVEKYNRLFKGESA